MESVEKEITQNNVELARKNPELQKLREREQTLTAPTPDLLDAFRPLATPIEGAYLSHPSEEFSLRVRAEYTNEGIVYSAALKDEGEMSGDALDRMEVPTEISKDAYEFYRAQPQFPDINFLRTKPLKGLAIDFIEGVEMPQVEYESELSDEEPAFVQLLKTGLVDMSSDPSVRKEVIAHRLHGSETLKPSGETIDAFAERMFKDMVATYTMGHKQVVVGVSGMSGSGKSTAVRILQEKFSETFGEEFTPVVLSSDDYHRGKKWLEDTYGAPWTNWDDPRVYNTAELASDIKRLADGDPIFHKHFDFATEEVMYDDIVAPSPFVIVEGLYAGSSDLKSIRTLHYEVPTSIATSIGRDVRRLVLEDRENGSIGGPGERLRYQLEVALPSYLEQEKPSRNSFAAYCRPLAERAFMLEKLS